MLGKLEFLNKLFVKHKKNYLFDFSKKSKARKQKNDNYQNVNSDNEFDQDNNGGLDSKNPYEDDAIEKFHSQGDKVLFKIFEI